ERIEEGHLVDQVGRDPVQQQSAFPQRLPYETEVEHLEIAHAAVDQLRRAGAGARGPVAHLDQSDPQTASAGVECGAGSDDTATDDEYVDVLGGDGLTCGRALLGIESSIHGADSTAAAGGTDAPGVSAGRP